MPTVKLNKNVFEKLVGKKLPLAELKDRISMLGTDLEGIDGDEINVEVFPDRPDMLSEQGFARAFASFIGVKTGLRKYDITPSDAKVIIDRSVKGVRPYTACAIVRGMKFDDEKIREIIQIQEKLHVTYGRNRKKAAIGIYPLEHIKLPIRYLAKDPEDIMFRPLEWKDEINGNDILELHPAGKEYAPLLECLDKFPVFVDADNKILSMPPIINSHETGRISEKTKDVFIECSGFDFNVLSICLNIIVTAMADMGGKVQSMRLKYPDEKRVTPDLAPKNHELKIGYANRLLGLELKKEDVAKLLERMGFGIEKTKEKDRLTVMIPAYRADIMHPVDIIEDIAIAYGYENFEEEIPNVATIGEEDDFQRFKRKVSEMLAGLGLLETNTYNLTNRVDQCQKMNCELKVVSLANALTEEHDVLRAWMIPSLLKVLGENKHHDYPQNIFEIGTIFKEDKSSETGVTENDRLGIALCGKDADFTRIKQVFDVLMEGIDLKYDTKDAEHPSFIPGRVGRISVNGKDVVYIGELHPEVISNFGLEMPVACLEFNLTELYRTL